jgi:hypothetical protein
MSLTPFVSPATRLLANEPKATKRPSALIAAPVATLLPSVPRAGAVDADQLGHAGLPVRTPVMTRR